MATKHTPEAVELYRRIESTLAAHDGLLESHDLQRADEWDTGILAVVLAHLNKVESAWVQANDRASAERIICEECGRRLAVSEYRIERDQFNRPVTLCKDAHETPEPITRAAMPREV